MSKADFPRRFASAAHRIADAAGVIGRVHRREGDRAPCEGEDAGCEGETAVCEVDPAGAFVDMPERILTAPARQLTWRCDTLAALTPKLIAPHATGTAPLAI